MWALIGTSFVLPLVLVFFWWSFHGCFSPIQQKCFLSAKISLPLSPPPFTLLSSLVPSFTHSHSFMLSLPRSPFLLFAFRSFRHEGTSRPYITVPFFKMQRSCQNGFGLGLCACPWSFITFTVKNVPQLFIYALFAREIYNGCPLQVLVLTADANLSTLSWKSFDENKKKNQNNEIRRRQ